MNWKSLTTADQIQHIESDRMNQFIVIFKHSTRCSISSMILHRLEREQSPDNIDFYFLDLIKYRELSHAIAAQFDVQHESPQILLIKNGKCIYNESHNGISLQALIAEAS